MIVGAGIALAVLVLLGLLFLRESDLPKAAPLSPFQHLDDRKASIYENLRDLQFEYRVGKLSDADYQQTKTDLQKELARVLAEIDRLKTELQVTTATVHAPSKAAMKAGKAAKAGPEPIAGSMAAPGAICLSCKAPIAGGMKFCGECGVQVTKAVEGTVCPSCRAEFPKPLKFCGECGASMTAIRSRA